MSSSSKQLFLVLFLVVSKEAFPQTFGGIPSSVRLKQINAPLSRVIFPRGLDSVATRVSNTIEFMNSATKKNNGTKTRKINIVLQPQTTIPNGYVQLGPYKSEFYLTPTQNSFELGSLPWPDQLAIHEYRHVQQYNNFDIGLSRVFHVLFGQEGQALANGAAVPDWFFEGDAVFNETEVSKQGRGRLPFFYNGYRSLWQSGKSYNWMKLRNGSYRDFVPNHYELGYLLVAYGRQRYGDDFWHNVTRDAASFKGIFYPLQKAIKKYAGVSYESFRDSGLAYFKNKFDIKSPDPTERQPFVNEEYPAFAPGAIVYVRSGYGQLPTFIVKRNNSEEKLRVKDVSLDNHFSMEAGKIVYASFRPDSRWGYRNFSELQLLDVNTGRQTTLTRSSKYFSPSLSPDGTRIVAVEVAESGKASLEILDTTGRLIQKVPNPDKLFFTYPKFVDSASLIAAVRDTAGRMSLAGIDIASGQVAYFARFGFSVVGFPFVRNDTIYFSGSYYKNDELFAFTLRDKKLWRITTGKEYGIGKYQPTANDLSIGFSSFSSSGYKIISVPRSMTHFTSVDSVPGDKRPILFDSTFHENAGLLGKVPPASLNVSRYPKSIRLLNFHSIQPTIDDPEYTIAFLSENILNTMEAQVAIRYDRAERSKSVGFQMAYGGWLPVLSAGINYTFDRRRLTGAQKQAYFNELEPYAGVNIPLNLSKGRLYTFLNFGSNLIYNDTHYKGLYADSFRNRAYSYLSNFISFTNQIQKTRQQIFPRLAQSLTLSYKNSMNRYTGRQFMSNVNVYLPGLSRNHSVVLQGAFLFKDSARQVSFSSGFPFSRGYQAANFYNMYKWSLNYHTNLVYPDAGFASIVYFLRARANWFYDYTHVKDFLTSRDRYAATFQSAGVELTFDTKWWNQAEVSFGVRYSRLLNEDLFGNNQRNRWELILPVNIFSQ